MVYLIVLRGRPQVVAEMREHVIRVSNGWQDVAPGVLLIGQTSSMEAIRAFLMHTPGIELAIVQLNGAWTAYGCADIANWLTAAEPVF